MITLEEEWTQYEIKFDEIEQAPSWGWPQDKFSQEEVYGINFQINGTSSVPANFDFCIDNLELIK
jgi:hypothetical protein